MRPLVRRACLEVKNEKSHPAFSDIPTLIQALQAGEFVILVDDEDRENEGDLVIAAQFVTPEKVNFLIREARGLVCLPLLHELAASLGLKQMVEERMNRSANQTQFTVSIEAAAGIKTGISADDRATTIRRVADPNVQPGDLVSPGHVFPITAHPEGLQARAGHTEASLELMRLAGLRPLAVICELIADDGTMSEESFDSPHELSFVTADSKLTI